MLIKEDIVPVRADKIVHFLAPILIAATAILSLGIIPYGRNMTPFVIDGGILFFFAVGSTTELAVFMAGWGSNNKFSMLGAMRAIAQMISYELPLIVTILPVVMIVSRPKSLRVWLRTALVCAHTLGICRLPLIFRFRFGRIEPDTVRRPGRRIRNRCRSHDRILRV
jgi:NADH:ubiquinone oxidoreductase subunit H